MVDNNQIRKINRLLRKQITQKFGVLAVALLVIGGIAYMGTQNRRPSQAATGAVLSMNPASGAFTIGSMVAVTLSEDSGPVPVDSVQASVSYDPAKLQYAGVTDGSYFPTITATGAVTTGLVRVGRETAGDSQVTGLKTVATVNFKVLAGSGTTRLRYDPAFSYVIRSKDNVNILTAVRGASYVLRLQAPAISGVMPESGPVEGGIRITVTGSNFANGATVTIGGAVASDARYVSAGTLTATAPPHAAGPADIVVTNPDGQTAIRQAAFNFIARPFR